MWESYYMVRDKCKGVAKVCSYMFYMAIHYLGSGGDPDFTFETVGVVVRIVQFLGEINRFVDKPKFYVHGTLFPNPNTLHSC